MAPCVYGLGFTYEGLAQTNQGFNDLGIYTFGGDDWTESVRKICANMGQYMCDAYSSMPEEMAAGPMNTLWYMYQNGVRGEF